jgi:hypothetical protein
LQARRNLQEQERLAAITQAENLENRTLPANLEEMQAEGEISELDLTANDRVFNRGGIPYVNINGQILKVTYALPEQGRPSSETGAIRKRGHGLPTPLAYNPIVQTRKQKEEEQRKREQERSVELHSLQMQSPKTDRLSQIESQIELLAITVKDGLAAVKTLSTRGASRESSQQRPRNTSGNAHKPRTESYNRGEVKDGRYSSKERRDFSQSRSHSKEESRVSRSSGYSVDRKPQQGSSSSYSAQNRAREQSKSPHRQGGNTSYAPDRKSRRDEHSQDRSRQKSFQARQTYPKMRKGENCSLDYDPLKQKTCSKCSKAGHHEFECFKYERYSPKKCTVCDKLNHFAGDCKELEKFPPKGRELNCMEAGKNY